MIDRILQAYAQSNYDFRSTAKPGDTLAHLFEQWVPYYRMKAAVSAALQPKTILEIGVRYGYSGAAFLHGSPQAHYTGIDLDADTFGGEKGAIQWASRIMPEGQCHLVVADSQKLTRFPGGIYDLIHVDGQQNELGTYHDLLLAIRQARYILVDGYFWTAENFHAVNDFLHRYLEDIEYALVIPGYAGEMLIKVKPTSLLASDTSRLIDSARIRYLDPDTAFLRNSGRPRNNAVTRDCVLKDGRLRSFADLLFIQPVQRVLDLSAGRGELACLAAWAGCDVTAVDYSASAVDILRETISKDPKLAEHIECICADATTFLPTGKYDVVVAGDLVEHLSPAELDRLYENVAQWLNPQGYFIVHTFPNRWYYDYAYPRRRRAAQRLGAHLPANPRSRFELLMHINEQSPRDLRRSLRRHFQHVELWFGSPGNPAGNLLQKASAHDLSEYRDLYALASASPTAFHPEKLFTSPALERNDFPLALVECPIEAKAGSKLSAQVRVTNADHEAVLASRPPFPVHLSYRWLDASGQPVAQEGWRNALVPALCPGRSHVYTINIVVPPEPGNYRVIFSLVQEHKFWLCNVRPDLCPAQSVLVFS